LDWNIRKESRLLLDTREEELSLPLEVVFLVAMRAIIVSSEDRNATFNVQLDVNLK
jgi:hypothetical protein